MFPILQFRNQKPIRWVKIRKIYKVCILLLVEPTRARASFNVTSYIDVRMCTTENIYYSSTKSIVST